MLNINDEKWTMLAVAVYDLFEHIDSLPDDVRVYILTHTEEDANGNTKMKTAGKMIDQVLNPEAQFTMVLGAMYKDNRYMFQTHKERNSQPYKSPMGMFEETFVDNDLAVIDRTICSYYGIGETE